jgi:hypothetical protein
MFAGQNFFLTFAATGARKAACAKKAASVLVEIDMTPPEGSENE